MTEDSLKLYSVPVAIISATVSIYAAYRSRIASERARQIQGLRPIAHKARFTAHSLRSIADKSSFMARPVRFAAGKSRVKLRYAFQPRALARKRSFYVRDIAHLVQQPFRLAKGNGRLYCCSCHALPCSEPFPRKQPRYTDFICN